MGQDGLGQDIDDRPARQHLRHLRQREAVVRAQREDDRVVVGGRLELEVEGDAEPLAQRQPERPVDAAAVGGVDDELRALALVEEPLDDDPVPGRQAAERGPAGRQVGDDLVGDLRRDTGPLLGRPPAPRPTGRRPAVRRAPRAARRPRPTARPIVTAPHPARTGRSARRCRRRGRGPCRPRPGGPATNACRGGRRRRCSPRPRSPRGPIRPSRRRGRGRPGSRRSPGSPHRSSARPGGRRGGPAVGR